MEAADSMDRCGARKKDGERCRRPAGWGTGHKGVGQCRAHGGNTPGNVIASERELAKRFAVGMLGAEVETDALGALVLSVRLAAGMVAYYRSQAASLVEDGRQTSAGEALQRDYAAAVERLARVSKTAIDAGVSIRQIELEERLAERLATAAESALRAWAEAQGLELSAEGRTLFARTFARELARAEDDDVLEGQLA